MRTIVIEHMKNTDFAAVVIVIVVAASALGGFVYYFRNNPTSPIFSSANTQQTTSVTSTPAHHFTVSQAYATLMQGNAYNCNPNCKLAPNFDLSMTITNNATSNLESASVYIDAVLLGSCNVEIFPNHYYFCPANGHIDCSALTGGLPYTMRVVASFVDGQQSEISMGITPSVGSC